MMPFILGWLLWFCLVRAVCWLCSELVCGKRLENTEIEMVSREKLIKIFLASFMFDIPLSQKFGDKTILKSKKLRVLLNLHEIYVIIFSFNNSKIELGSFFLHLFNAFVFSMDNYWKSEEPMSFRNIQIASKILEYTIKERMKDLPRNLYEKRIKKMLLHLEFHMSKLPMKSFPTIEAIDLASSFIPHSSTPGVFFRTINEALLHAPSTITSPKNFQIFNQFVQNLLQAYEPKYCTLSARSFYREVPEVSLTLGSQTLLLNLLDQFSSSKNGKYELLGIEILTNSHLFPILFPSEEEKRKKVQRAFDSLVLKDQKKWKGETFLKIKVSNFEKLTSLLKFAIIHKEIIQVQELFDFFYPQTPKIIEECKETTFQSVLPFVYWLTQCFLSSSFLHAIETDPKRKPDFSSFLSELKGLTVDFIIPKVLENHRHTFLQVKYQEATIQHFLPHVFNLNFSNMEYVLPIISALGVETPHGLQPLILSQLKRSFKRWDASTTIQNILFFKNYEADAWEFLEGFLANFSIFFEYKCQNDSLEIIKDLSQEDLVQVLQVFISQFEKAGKPAKKRNMLFFAYLVTTLSHRLSSSQLTVAHLFQMRTQTRFVVCLF